MEFDLQMRESNQLVGLRLCGSNLFHLLKHIFQEEIIAQVNNQVSLLHGVGKHVIVNGYFQAVDVKFSRSGSPEHYEYACKVFHKLGKFKSLSSTQNCLLSPAQIYLVLTMPRDRSLVFDWFV